MNFYAAYNVTQPEMSFMEIRKIFITQDQLTLSGTTPKDLSTTIWHNSGEEYPNKEIRLYQATQKYTCYVISDSGKIYEPNFVGQPFRLCIIIIILRA
ncbi:hypothetical protein NQZ79_g7793 [Umbelopsis isabellina]|nr:hypothetical protein NQZ79_g7793 [Umbelopsis isabellina]